jgi:alkylhydroperoxidase family enzyme
VAAWRDAPYFTPAERAALALTEAVTRLNDRADPVPDEVWEEAARHYDQRALAALIVAIGAINFWNRINVSTRQVAGEWMKSAEARKWVEEHAVAR